MKQKRIAIIDDESDSREILRTYLAQEYQNIDVVAEADSVKSGVELLNTTEIDLLFLDIQFPSGTGFDILKTAVVSDFRIIFITAYDEFAIKAIKHNAFDYVLKPLDREELCNVVNKYLSREAEKEVFNSSIVQNQLSLPTSRGFKVVELDKLMHLESDGNYTKLYMQDGDEILVSRPIKEYENILPKEIFCRVHNSHIINTTFLTEYIRGRGGEVILKDGSVISVSQNKKSHLLNYYK